MSWLTTAVSRRHSFSKFCHCCCFAVFGALFSIAWNVNFGHTLMLTSPHQTGTIVAIWFVLNLQCSLCYDITFSFLCSVHYTCWVAFSLSHAFVCILQMESMRTTVDISVYYLITLLYNWTSGTCPVVAPVPCCFPAPFLGVNVYCQFVPFLQQTRYVQGFEYLYVVARQME